MTGIQYLMDEKGRKVAVQIDLKRRRAVWQDFRDGFVSESRRKEKAVSYGSYRTSRLRRAPKRG